MVTTTLTCSPVTAATTSARRGALRKAHRRRRGSEGAAEVRALADLPEIVSAKLVRRLERGGPWLPTRVHDEASHPCVSMDTLPSMRDSWIIFHLCVVHGWALAHGPSMVTATLTCSPMTAATASARRGALRKAHRRRRGSECAAEVRAFADFPKIVSPKPVVG